MIPSLTLRVFVASPSDAAPEREIVRERVEAVNEEQRHRGGPQFELVGMEVVRGTARRPQEAINELIHSCHFMLVIFKDRWGSSPGGALGYTSGTEEELFTALLDLGRPTRIMRDVWVAFVSAASPAPELLELREQIKTNNALLYDAPTDSLEFRRMLTERLRGWALAGEKAARSIDLRPRSGIDVLRADRLRQHGELLMEYGDPKTGIEKLEEAANLGGPEEYLALAAMLARQGRMDEAHNWANRAVTYFFERTPEDFNSPSAAEALAMEASLLRRDRKPFEATQRLKQALAKLTGDDEYTRRVKCRVLDDLGLAYQHQGELAEARSRFQEALSLREESEDTLGMAQSIVNLARIDVASKDDASGAERARVALEMLRSLPPTGLHANAHALRAQTLLRLGQASEAREQAEMSRVLNVQLGNPYGAAIAHNLLAQCFEKLGETSKALEHAYASKQANIDMGRATVPQLLAAMIERLERSTDGAPVAPDRPTTA